MNIFAQVLVKILQEHNKELGSLYHLQGKDEQGNEYVIFPNKVTRLKKSLTMDMTATLNTVELELLRSWIGLSDDDMRRLRVALLAEAVRSMMAGRIGREVAYQIGEATFRMLLTSSAKESYALSQQLVENVRVLTHQELQSDTVEIMLEPAVEAYEQGLLWLEVARDTVESGARQGFSALAKSFLTHAHSLTEFAPQAALSTPQQLDLLALIDTALLDIELLS